MTCKVPSLFENCILWWTGCELNEFPIIPSGVTITNNGTWKKDNLGNNKSVMKFDGSSNYISLSDNNAWDIGLSNEPFTIGIWFKSTYISNIQCLLYFINNMDWSATGIQWILHTEQQGSSGDYKYLNFAKYRALGDHYILDDTNYPSSAIVVDGNWNFIVINYNGTMYSIYNNGVLCGSKITDPVQLTSATKFTIGFNLNGSLKDLMIFKGRALTQPEITTLMRLTHPITGEGVIPGPYDYWRLS